MSVTVWGRDQQVAGVTQAAFSCVCVFFASSVTEEEEGAGERFWWLFKGGLTRIQSDSIGSDGRGHVRYPNLLILQMGNWSLVRWSDLSKMVSSIKLDLEPEVLIFVSNVIFALLGENRGTSWLWLQGDEFGHYFIISKSLPISCKVEDAKWLVGDMSILEKGRVTNAWHFSQSL